MKKLLTVALATISIVGYSQQQVVTNTTPTIPILVSAPEKQLIESVRVRVAQQQAMRELQKVTDTNVLARITAEVKAAQVSSNKPSN